MPFRFSLVLAVALALAPLAAPAATRAVDVDIVTTAGTIVVRLDTHHAPVTTRNFLAHVDRGTYARGATFYRVADTGLHIIQGGIEPRNEGAIPPIPVEKTTQTGLHNVAATIAMARTQGPASATTEFFINTGDDTRLDADKFPDGFGYAVFGTIVNGMDVVRAIQREPVSGEYLVKPIAILRIVRARHG